MKNRRWFRLAGWLLTLVMLLTVIPAATFAEGSSGNTDESNELKPVSELIARPAEVDITSSVRFAYTNENGKSVKVEAMNPNKENRMTLTVSGLDANQAIAKETVMTVTLPENIKITVKGLKAFSNDAVSARVQDGKLLLSWKGEKQDAVEASFAVLPNIPAENDLSGTYALVTKNKVLVGASTFVKDNRNRITSSSITEKNGKVYPETEGRSVWTLKHVSGNYYTVYSEISRKYMKIVPPNQADMERTSEEDAQKIQVQTTGDGYYTFLFEGLNLNNQGKQAPNGFASFTAGTADNEKFRLRNPADIVYTDLLSFSVNGGTGDTDPETIAADAGTQVTLPSINATKNGQEFIGWADVKDIFTKATGTNHTYHDVYLPGSSYTMKDGKNTLYAVYNATNRKVQFGIRKDGVIVDEPNDNNVSDYIGHFPVEDILKVGHWVIDINPTKPVNGYYVENNVTAALNWVPSAEEIAKALKKEGNVDFDPETQYVHYYVLKYAGQWKVDGVIRNKTNVEITYDANVPDGLDKTRVIDLPGGYQVAPGTDILIGADEGSTEVKRPALKGYYFMGWNTERDGSGTYYNEKRTIHMTNNLYLYAQWISEEDEVLEIRITSDWTAGKTGRVGDRITLTAELTGFEGKEYTLKWQYSTDLVNWTDVPDAHEITYTYILDETTTHYTWRAVAEDIR